MPPCSLVDTFGPFRGLRSPPFHHMPTRITTRHCDTRWRACWPRLRMTAHYRLRGIYAGSILPHSARCAAEHCGAVPRRTFYAARTCSCSWPLPLWHAYTTPALLLRGGDGAGTCATRIFRLLLPLGCLSASLDLLLTSIHLLYAAAWLRFCDTHTVAHLLPRLRVCETLITRTGCCARCCLTDIVI